MRRITKPLLLAVTLTLWFAVPAGAVTLTPVGEFDQPIFVTSNPSSPDDLFVVEREGRVVRVVGGSSSVFAAYTGKPAAGGAEGDVHVDAFHHEGEALVREPIFAVGHSANANHNGGQLELGPDGFLYVSTGDGGGGGDPFESGQDLGSLLGKILRVEPRAGAEPQVWSYGLRNPWRFSFDRANGDMVIGDVGQGAREEVDVARSPAPGAVGGQGVNYGWNCREGFIAYTEPGESCTGASGFTDPIFDYPHEDPEDGSAHGCAVTGGYVVRDPSLGNLYGRYVYADFCVGEIRSLLLPVGGGLAADDRAEGLQVENPASFGEDSCGRLYVVSQGGTVYRFVGSAPEDCGSMASGSAAAGPPRAVGAVAERGKVRVGLRVKRRGSPGRLRLTLTVRVVPCPGLAGELVGLRRGGQAFRARRLNDGCAARFRVTISHRSTFRAVLAGGYRSQVRTIALAKPRP